MAASLKPIRSTAVKTLFLTTAAFAALVMVAPIGKARADEELNLPHLSGRYFVAECVEVDSATAGAKWTLDTDTVQRDVEFWPENHPGQWRAGAFQAGPTTMTAVISDQTGHRMNLALVTAHNSPSAALTWVQGWKSGKLNCYVITASDEKPWGWHGRPLAVQPPA
jgi:hypothetical protein